MRKIKIYWLKHYHKIDKDAKPELRVCVRKPFEVGASKGIIKVFNSDNMFI